MKKYNFSLNMGVGNKYILKSGKEKQHVETHKEKNRTLMGPAQALRKGFSRRLKRQ